MISRKWKMTVGMGIVLPLFAFLFGSGLSMAATIIVPDQHATIQGAIDAAAGGDTVLVRAGTYQETIDFLGKAITVRSESGADFTVIEGGQVFTPVVTFENDEGLESVLDGFTITRSGPGTSGRGIYCVPSGPSASTSPTIVNNIITGHVSEGPGAGIFVGRGAAFISGNRIVGNEVIRSRDGGGIYCYGGTQVITDCVIAGNRADGAGGGLVFARAVSPGVSRCDIKDNQARYGGGGIFCEDSDFVSITGCSVRDNEAGFAGGGIAVDNCGSDIVNTLVAGNRASSNGGGVEIRNFGYSPFPNLVCCSTISGNTATVEGGGIWYEGQAYLQIDNSIVWGNAASQTSELYVGVGSYAYATSSDIGGGWPGTGNIDADPLFGGPGVGDYHLGWGSPCIGTGDDTLLPSGLTDDFEGDPRVYQGKLDVGADEFYVHLYVTSDLVPGSTIDIRTVGTPHFPVTLLRGSGRLTRPVYTAYGPLHLMQPFLSLYQLGTVPASGVLSIPATIPAGWKPGWVFHYQALVGPTGSPFSKLTNLFSVVVE